MMEISLTFNTYRHYNRKAKLTALNVFVAVTVTFICLGLSVMLFTALLCCKCMRRGGKDKIRS